MSAPVAVTNTTADTIPPGAAMEPVGTADANGRLRVRKPTADDSLAVLINSGTPIPAGQAGTGHLPWFGPLAAAADATLIDAATGGWAGTGPAVLGVKSGSWHLHAGRTGFVVQAEPLGGLVPVQAGVQATTGPRSYLLDVPCPVPGGGLAGIVVHGSGASAECVVKGFCGGTCDETAVPPPPPPPSGEAMLAVRYDGGEAEPHTARVYDGAAWSPHASLAGGGYAFGPYPVGDLVTVELTAPTSGICWTFDGVAGSGSASGTGVSATVPITGSTFGGNGVVVFYDCGDPVPPPPPPPGPPVLATISGTAQQTTDGTTFTALSGRSVELMAAGMTTTTDGSGGYSFSGIYGSGTRFVRLTLASGESAVNNVDGGGFTVGDTASVALSATTHDADFRVQLPAVATVNVLVQNVVGGTPLSGRTVTIGATSQATNGSGQASFAGVAVGSTAAVLTLAGGESASWAVDTPAASGKGATATFTSSGGGTHGVTFQVNLSGGGPSPGPGGGE